MTARIKQYPLVAFFGLTYVFLVLGWIVFQAQIPLGPLLAALIVVPIISGREGLTAWAKRIIQWRFDVRWYIAAIFLPLAATGTAALLNVLLGASAARFELSTLPELIPEAIFIFLLVGLGEEPGFRGFALPRLQGRYSAVTATLILGVLGSIWHIPLFLSDDSPWATIPVIITGYFAFTWLFNNTNGSVWIAMIFHTAQAIFGPQIFGTMFTGGELISYTWLIAIFYGVFAAVVIITSGSSFLSTKPKEELTNIAEPMPAR